MPHFYLHYRNGDGLVHDEEGSEFPDLATARIEAVAAARDLMAADLRTTGNLRLSEAIEIDDANGDRVLVLAFREAVTIEA